MEKLRDKPEAKIGWVLILGSLPLLLFLIIPCLGLIFSGSGIFAGLLEPQVIVAMRLSMYTTAITTIVTVIAGTPVAYLLARKKFPGKTALDTFIDLPMVLPPSVAGIALLLAFGRRGFLGDFLSGLDIQIPFTQTAVVLAQLFVAAPFFVKSAAAGFANVHRDLEEAAAIDGASPWKIFLTLTVPLSSHALMGGALMTWARALGEFGATIIFAGNYPGRTQTMPLAIYIGFELDMRVALSLALILLAISSIVLAVVRGVLRERLLVP